MPLSNKKCLFLVQGEGRGHITQSISMKQLIEESGMKVCEIMVGKSERRTIPAFYHERVKVPITPIESPNMATDKNKKAIKALPSLWDNIRKAPRFLNSLFIIHRKIKEHKPDIIINFYEPLAGIYYLLFRPKIPMICIGHHYLFNHPDYEMPPGHFFARIGLKLWTGLISIGSRKKLAISFYPFEDCKEKNIYIIPPLLRDEVLCQPVSHGEYLLVYLLNSGYMEDIIKWHNQNPQIKLHCFVDSKDISDYSEYDANLCFHQINDKKFLSMIAECKGLVSTSGFESVCEAMYMNKPVLMVPVKGHFEQFCNSLDAARAGAGISDTTFDITRFLSYLSTSATTGKAEFKEWVNQSQILTLKYIHNVLYENNNVRQLHPYPSTSKKVAYHS